MNCTRDTRPSARPSWRVSSAGKQAARARGFSQVAFVYARGGGTEACICPPSSQLHADAEKGDEQGGLIGSDEKTGHTGGGSAHAIDAAVADVGAREPGMGEIGAAEVALAEYDAGEIGLVEIGFGQVA